MRTEKLNAVSVCSTNDGDEYYEVGKNEVTEIKWSGTNGHMAPLDTVQVYKNGRLYSEHVFTQVLGVYFGITTQTHQ